MGSVFQPYRRDRFGLNLDPNDVFGPNLLALQAQGASPARTDGPPEIFGPSPSVVGPTTGAPQAPDLFTPPPSGPMNGPITGTPPPAPPVDALAAANATLQPRTPPTAQEDVFGPSPSLQGGRGSMEMPEAPAHIPYPKPVLNFVNANAHNRAAVDEENRFNDTQYQAKLRAWQGLQREPPNRTAQDVYLDPKSTPQQKADAKWWLENQPGRFQTDKQAAMTPDQLYADAQAHPENYPNGRAEKIIKDYQEGRKYAFPDQRPDRPQPDVPVYGYDDQGRQVIDHWENPVTHRRTDAGEGMIGTGRNPPRPGATIDRGDPRREQFIKEYLRQNPGDEEGLTTQLQIYDRGNSPAIRKGRARVEAGRTPGQDQGPTAGGVKGMIGTAAKAFGLGGGPAAAPAATSQANPVLPHPPAATKTGLLPRHRYRINGQVVETDAQGNVIQNAAPQ
jgi:hypothetical protein